MLALALLASIAMPQAAPMERPRDIWVFRSVLDQRARIVTIALNEDMWVAYDATHCALYKAWKGGVKFDGAVYTAAHGPQPTTQGALYMPGIIDRPVWTLREGSSSQPVKAEFKGYRFVGKQVTLSYRMSLPGGKQAMVRETPEFLTGTGGAPVLQRSFKVEGLPKAQRLALEIGPEQVQTDGTINVHGSGRSIRDLVLNNGSTTTATWSFQSTPEKLFASIDEDRADDEIAQEPSRAREPGVAVRVYEVGEELSSVPVLVAGQTPNVEFVSPQIDFGSAADFKGPEDQFLVHVIGFLNIEKGGAYQFRLSSDDGSILWIGGREVVNHDGLHGAQDPKVGEDDLSAGEHPFRIEYFENGADQALRLEWKKPGDADFSLVPSNAFTTTAGVVRVTAPGKKRVLPRGSTGRPGDRQPLAGVHPSFTLTNLRPKNFNPRVGGIDFLPDGRMVLCAWEADGGVYLLDGVTGPAHNVTVKRIAAGLAEPLGLKVVDGKIFVLQKQELTQLIDHNGDDVIDEYHAVANGWGVTANFHEFAFGLAYKDRAFYATLATAIDPGGASTKVQNIDRGRVVKIHTNGKFEFIASGLRTPNGIGLGPKGEIIVADNQGDWLPSSKLLLVKPGSFFGNRSVDPIGTKGLVDTPPIVWLPQNEIGNSPSQPTFAKDGPYKGQLLHGDVTHGGLKRTFTEVVDGVMQGAVMRFTQGLEAGVNRVAWGPDGALYIGGIGSTGNWGQEGKSWYGLQKIKYNGAPTFEILAVRARTNGIELEMTEPLAEGAGLSPGDYTIETFRYVPTPQYGGPKVDDIRLRPRSVTVSPDRKRIFLETPMKAGTVVYVRMDPLIPSATGRQLWSTEAWYTLNRVPQNRLIKPNPVTPNAGQVPAQETREGFVPLFDGSTLSHWRGFGKQEMPTAWSIREGTLTFTPGSGTGGDIVTKEEYGDFELRFDWRISEGGNSGVFYRSDEKYGAAWGTGPEYQILDNDRHQDGRSPLTSAASNYALIGPSKNVVRPVGEWNTGRIVVKGDHVEHWLNGFKVVEYTFGSPEWTALVKKSKFASVETYGKAKIGRIVLQDHGNVVSYRNIRIKRL